MVFLIQLGLKTCEGRLNKGDFAKLKKNDYIIYENNDFGFMRKYKTKITSIHNYDSFKNYLEKESLKKCLSCINNIIQKKTKINIKLLL
jgi:ASC-1-like (ASCH) protein